MMKPILFSTPMVQAILAGKKTQARRVVTRKGYNEEIHQSKTNYAYHEWDDLWQIRHRTKYSLHGGAGVCPRYQTGDILWVRETWTENCGMLQNALSGKKIHYCADCKPDTTGLFAPCKWKKKPSIFMPRAAARLFLRVKNVRAERLQDISEEDAIAEGVDGIEPGELFFNFIALWNSLNAKRGYGWEANPWVWVYTFERSVPV